jgi:hypothetical protein
LRQEIMAKTGNNNPRHFKGIKNEYFISICVLYNLQLFTKVLYVRTRIQYRQGCSFH